MSCPARRPRSINGRQGRTSLLRERLNLPPPLCHRVVEGQNSPREPEAQITSQLALESRAPQLVLRKQLDAFANLADRDHAQVEQRFRGRIDPGRYPRIRAPLHELRNHVGIEQETSHGKRQRCKAAGLSFTYQPPGRPSGSKGPSPDTCEKGPLARLPAVHVRSRSSEVEARE